MTLNQGKIMVYQSRINAPNDSAGEDNSSGEDKKDYLHEKCLINLNVGDAIFEPYEHSPNIDHCFYSEFVNNKFITLKKLLEILFQFQKNQFNDQQLREIEEFICEFFVEITSMEMDDCMINWDNFNHFFKLFGPSQNILFRIFNLSDNDFFHGFIRGAEAKNILKNKPGSFLFRYSESLSDQGYFSFNLNRKKNENSSDELQNFSLPYDSIKGCFIFDGDEYHSLQQFIKDEKYKNSFINPVSKHFQENFQTSFENLQIEDNFENVIKSMSPNNVYLKFQKNDQAIIIKDENTKKWPAFDTVQFGPLNCPEITEFPGYITVTIPTIRCSPWLQNHIILEICLYRNDKPVGKGVNFTYMITKSLEIYDFVKNVLESGRSFKKDEMLNWRDENKRTLLHHIGIVKDVKLFEYLMNNIGIDIHVLDVYDYCAKDYLTKEDEEESEESESEEESEEESEKN